MSTDLILQQPLQHHPRRFDRVRGRARVATTELHPGNVEAYVPGDIRQFFVDPRTRQDYLQWAGPMVLAEQFHYDILEALRWVNTAPLQRGPYKRPKYAVPPTSPERENARKRLSELWSFYAKE